MTYIEHYDGIQGYIKGKLFHVVEMRRGKYLVSDDVVSCLGQGQVFLVTQYNDQNNGAEGREIFGLDNRTVAQHYINCLQKEITERHVIRVRRFLERKLLKVKFK